MQIKCDTCSAVSETVVPETCLESDVEFTFFRCRECGEVYPVCATDTALRADIAEYTRMRNLIRVKPVKEQFICRAEALKQKSELFPLLRLAAVQVSDASVHQAE